MPRTFINAERALQPRLRGVMHEYSVGLFAAAAVVLIILAGSARARIAMVVYAIGVVGCLATSAVYHRGDWSPVIKRRLGRVDHSVIFLLIAGTYTPVCLLVLPGALGVGMLIGVWAGAAVGITLSLLPFPRPTWLEVAPYLVVGWVAVAAIPVLLQQLGWGAVMVMLGGGLLYSVGAVIYSKKWPNPLPKTFGYHEIFHACVVAAAAAHCVVMFVWVLPRGRI